MADNKKIVIGDKVFTLAEFFQRKEDFRKQRAKLSFEKKIKILVDLQKLAKEWGGKDNIFIWKI
ncbi:MAG: hypothetical protein ABIL02_06810 [candidate division WOR-3 bacterium]